MHFNPNSPSSCAVICEYNPFHSGHAYQLQKARELSGADLTVCIMSGEFMQRGEPAICDKWTRAKMALRSGADIVIELPVPFAIGSAERFCRGAVRMVHALGINALAFGAEYADLDTLQSAADILNREPDVFRDALHRSLADGASYASARRRAFAKAAPQIAFALDEPNTVLGIEYIRAAENIGADITMYPVLRLGSDHACSTPFDREQFPSSAAVRAALQQSSGTRWGQILQAAGTPVSFKPTRWRRSLFTLVSAMLRNADASMLDRLPDAEPGIAHRLIAAARNSGTWDELVTTASSRRHPPARIRRLLLSALLGVDSNTVSSAFLEANLYGHVLGIRDGAQQMFGQLCSSAGIPVSPSPRSFTKSPLLAADLVSCDMYGLLVSPVRHAGADFTTPLQVVIPGTD